MPQFGRSHCIVPDVDGDGIEDVLVGESSERFSSESERASGAVYLLSGATGRGLQRFGPTAEVLHFGSSITAVPPALSSRFADAVVLSQAQGSRTTIKIDFLDLRKGLRSEQSILLHAAKPGGTSRALFLPNSPGMQADFLIRHNRAPEGASLLFVSLESKTIVREIPIEGPGFVSAETLEIFEPSEPSGIALLLCGSPAVDNPTALGRVEVIRLRDAKIIHTLSSAQLGPHFGGAITRNTGDRDLSFLASTLPRHWDRERASQVDEVSLYEVTVPVEGSEWQVKPVALRGLDGPDLQRLGTHVSAMLRVVPMGSQDSTPVVVVSCPEEPFTAYLYGFDAGTHTKLWRTSADFAKGADYYFGNMLGSRAFAGANGEAWFLCGTAHHLTGHTPWLCAVRAIDGQIIWHQNLETVKAALKR